MRAAQTTRLVAEELTKSRSSNGIIGADSRWGAVSRDERVDPRPTAMADVPIDLTDNTDEDIGA